MRKSTEIGFIFENEVAEKLKTQGFTHVKITKHYNYIDGEWVVGKSEEKFIAY